MHVSEETLDWLQALSDRCDPPPWTASVEGRDHQSGDDFIVVGHEGDRGEDIYVTRDSGPANSAYLDLIAAARSCLPSLIEEIREHRARIE